MQYFFFAILFLYLIVSVWKVTRLAPSIPKTIKRTRTGLIPLLSKEDYLNLKAGDVLVFKSGRKREVLKFHKKSHLITLEKVRLTTSRYFTNKDTTCYLYGDVCHKVTEVIKK